MSRTMNSQALVLLDRILGLSGPGGEQYTTLDDGNVQQVLEISEVARRSLTPAGSSGLFTIIARNTSTVVSALHSQDIDPYNLAAELTLTADTNGWPVPVGRGFDVWLIGASMWSGYAANIDFGQLNMLMPESATAIYQHQTDNATPVQATDTSTHQLVVWDTPLDEDVMPGATDMRTWATENGTIYVPFNMRLVRGVKLNWITYFNAVTATAYVNLIMGIFPEGLGQDIAT